MWACLCGWVCAVSLMILACVACRHLHTALQLRLRYMDVMRGCSQLLLQLRLLSRQLRTTDL